MIFCAEHQKNGTGKWIGIKYINLIIKYTINLIFLSLNIYNEWNNSDSMILDDSLICTNLQRTIFSYSNTGNILEWDNQFLDDLIIKCGKKILLITADGSFDCTVMFFLI